MIIDIRNETDTVLEERYIAEIKNAVALALESEGFFLEAELSIVITDNDRIRGLNKKYRKIDSETDVLSFPALELTSGEYDKLVEPVYLGDIVISIEKAASQCREYRHSFLRELVFLAVHSVLHLLGYDHVTDDEAEAMIHKQRKILEKAGIAR